MKFKNLLILSCLIISKAIASGGDDSGNGGSNFLERTQVNQYTCLTFSGIENSSGQIERTGVAKSFNYYLDEEMPDPVAPGGRMYVCHDVHLYGLDDSAEFPRLGLIEEYFPLFSRFDSRFDGNNGKKKIDSLIEEKVMNDLNIKYTSDLFKTITIDKGYGYLLKPLMNLQSNKIYCPNSNDLNANPFDKIVISFTGDTEGLYLGSFEAQPLPNVPTVYSSIYVTEKNLMKYGFYLRDGIKNRVSNVETLDTKAVFFYHPMSDSQDPLVKGNRRLVTVRLPDTNTSTKKLGCIYKK